jgi:hypothetical protein
LLFVLFCVLFVCKCVLPPGDNPIAVNKYIILLSCVYMFVSMLTSESKSCSNRAVSCYDCDM